MHTSEQSAVRLRGATSHADRYRGRYDRGVLLPILCRTNVVLLVAFLRYLTRRCGAVPVLRARCPLVSDGYADTVEHQLIWAITYHMAHALYPVNGRQYGFGEWVKPALVMKVMKLLSVLMNRSLRPTCMQHIMSSRFSVVPFIRPRRSARARPSTMPWRPQRTPRDP